MDRRRWIGKVLGAACGLATISALGPAHAGHCEECNPEATPSSVELGANQIGIDQVMVIRLVDAGGRKLDDAWWDRTEVTVFDAEGVEIPGALETYPVFQVAGWRPNAGWTPGNYDIEVYVDRGPSESPLSDGCYPAELSAQLQVVDEFRHVSGTPTLTVEEHYVSLRAWGLEDLVCCNGALPFWKSPSNGMDCGNGNLSPTLEGAGDFCTHLRENGLLSIEGHGLIDGHALGPHLSLLEVATGKPAKAFSSDIQLSISNPRCLTWRFLDLDDGTNTELHTCHGVGAAGVLGPHDVDPLEMLAANCESTAYTCETYGNGWDAERCTSWPGGAPYVPAPPVMVGDEEEDPAPGAVPESDTDGGSAPRASLSCTFGSGPTNPGRYILIFFVLACLRRPDRAAP